MCETASCGPSQFHYGWLIIMAAAIGSFMTLPGQTTGVAVFFDPLAEGTRETRGALPAKTPSARIWVVLFTLALIASSVGMVLAEPSKPGGSA